MPSIPKAIDDRPFLCILLVVVVASLLTSAKPTHPNPSTFRASSTRIEQKIDSLLAKMTPEEKFGQLNQLSGNAEHITDEHVELVKKGLVGSFLNVVGAEVTKKVQRIAVEGSRLGIPLIFGFDVIHG